jgi:hypothetical protein
VYKSDENNTTQYGLIAEEVDAIVPELVIHDEEGLPLTVRYEVLPVLLLKELQKQNVIIKKLETLIPMVEDLKQEIIDLKNANNVKYLSSVPA